MKLNKLFLALIVCISAFLTSCHEYVPAGNVGIKVYMYGSNKGVDNEVLGPGKYWIGMNEALYLFPTNQQNYVWTASKDEGKSTDESFSFQTADGLSIGTDVGVSYQINPNKVSVLFQKYRGGLDEITNVHLRNAV